MKKEMKSNAINYGLYLGAGLSVYTILCYGINLELLVNFWIAFIIIPIAVITTGVFSILKSKSLNDGHLSFKEAFSSFFITIAIALIIHTLVNIIIFNFVDPEAALRLKEVIVQKTFTMMENFNAPAEAMSEAIEEIENQDSFGIPTQIRGLAQSIAFFSIIGLIVAAIMKKPKESIDSL